MPIHDTFHRLPLSSIHVDRAKRQRRELVVDDLLQSIPARGGVMQPIIVEERPDGSIWLIAGERRLEASRQLGLPDIIARFTSELSQLELMLIEFEENVKRQDLSWTDTMDAAAAIHSALCAENPEQTQEETANTINLSKFYLNKLLTLSAASAEFPELREVSDFQEAFSKVKRREQRAAGAALAELLADANDLAVNQQDQVLGSAPKSNNTSKPSPEPSAKPAAPASRWPQSILNESFLEWAPRYTGPKFTVLHCDFPYGIGLFAGAQARGSTSQVEQYDDSKDVYFTLLNCLLANLDRVMSLSGHLYFWLSLKHYDETRQLFRERAPSLRFAPNPLIWGKSDNSGIIGDARRDPRHTYEVCLFARRSDRMVVKSVADFYWAPTDRSLHPSAKPEPVLRHFLSMTVDETTSLLDPTCGSASALRAAESLGAPHVLGLEIEPETCDVARTALLNSRLLRSASQVVTAK